MDAEERKAFGARVAQLRKQRGMKQEELGAAIGRTSSWVSQVERGVQPVVRLDVLQLLADGLGVSVQVLSPDAPTAPAGAPVEAATDEPNDLDEARLLISGHPALDVVLAEEAAEIPDLPALTAAVDEVWALTHAARFAELSSLLGRLVPRLERAARTGDPEARRDAQTLLSATYQALAAAFVRQDEADAAWLAADRSIRAAEMSEQPLQVFAGIFRLAQAFVRLKRLDQAEHAASSAVNALKPHTTGESVEPEALSVLGSLHLVLALVHARAGQRIQAREQIANARAVAARLGEDRNDFNLEFGPTNVEIQAVSTAVELGDAGEALDIGQSIDPTTLSAERRSRLLMDLGRAHAQRRHIGEALDSLLRAEELAPETVRTHVAARATIRELVLIAGRAAPPELLGLAERANVSE
ncbi:helix-turn-helix domain-containing protein [Yinghuangia soli]|uniref:Helix-turn-helix domain-containing protein n=1 Tax=Yinghuangia soli TaxID=2908204 RepID=A0AA41QA35_9ACTN|nr:helix-turn-helix transcriptional regulator [Yinghuangia soli]MCF2533705.1 helix-turn-helix domain-containing protein [Yinghuangia soli]